MQHYNSPPEIHAIQTLPHELHFYTDWNDIHIDYWTRIALWQNITSVIFLDQSKLEDSKTSTS
jgi:hypothetical protein